MREALEKILAFTHKAKVASCTCATKTSLMEYHNERCHYRQISEIHKIALLATQKEIHEGQTLNI